MKTKTNFILKGITLLMFVMAFAVVTSADHSENHTDHTDEKYYTTENQTSLIQQKLMYNNDTLKRGVHVTILK